ncbi:MAG: flagellar hook-associated protein FlgK [Tranquillimonas sp.]
MSISSAFNVSRSGMTAAEAWADLASANIANANRPGYAGRSISFTTAGSADGASVGATGVRRAVDEALVAKHRVELARVGTQEAKAAALEAYTTLLGAPGSSASPATTLAGLQNALDLLANEPGNAGAQQGVVDAAVTMARALNDAGQGLEQTVADNEAGLQRDVQAVNDIIDRVAELNRMIRNQPEATSRRAALDDEVSVALDDLAQLVDFRSVIGANGEADLFTAKGTPLLQDGLAIGLTYDRSTGTLFAGGVDVTPGQPGVRGFSEGALAGRFELKQTVLPQMQRQLDEFARVLVAGSESADGTLTPGQAGLFTDAQGAFAAAGLDGLAARIEVNDAVRTERGGDLWRIRDGIGAAAPGPESGQGQIGGLVALLSDAQGFDPSAGLGATQTLTDFAAAMVADQQQARVAASDRATALKAGAEAVEASRAGIEGVNIDDQLQQLMQIEQAYAANSQVLRTLGDMLDTLLEIVR